MEKKKRQKTASSQSKIQKLHQLMPSHGVATSQWLREKCDIYQQLADTYVKSGWLTRLGSGAYAWKNYKPTIEFGIQALQEQQGLSIHLGGKTSLELFRQTRFLPLGKNSPVYLFTSNTSEQLPRWFQGYKWGREVYFIKTRLFPENFQLGMRQAEKNGVLIRVSSLERAVFEFLYGLEKWHAWDDVDSSFERLFALDGELLQKLLEKCRSIKVKRLFLVFAERHQHRWFHRLNLKKISLGSGVRQFYKGGAIHPVYKITVPEFLLEASQSFLRRKESIERRDMRKRSEALFPNRIRKRDEE